MRTVLWILAWVGAALWSFGALVAWIALGFGADIARGLGGYVPGFPVEIFSLPWFAALAQGVGGSAVLFTWLFGLLLIFAVPLVAGLFLPRKRRYEPRYWGDRSRAAPSPMAPPAPPRFPGMGRSTTPFGDLPGRAAKSDLARKLLKRIVPRG
jgi:hypothetical protein